MKSVKLVALTLRVAQQICPLWLSQAAWLLEARILQKQVVVALPVNATSLAELQICVALCWLSAGHCCTVSERERSESLIAGRLTVGLRCLEQRHGVVSGGSFCIILPEDRRHAVGGLPLCLDVAGWVWPSAPAPCKSPGPTRPLGRDSFHTVVAFKTRYAPKQQACKYVEGRACTSITEAEGMPRDAVWATSCREDIMSGHRKTRSERGKREYNSKERQQ